MLNRLSTNSADALPKKTSISAMPPLAWLKSMVAPTLMVPAAMVTLTFFAGLIPIVGNLICNSVITLVGVSVSPTVGLACLVFLILIHKAEYIINAKILGRQTNTAAWELLAVMFVGEAVFGLPGLVAAPLYYAYVKKELQAARLV